MTGPDALVVDASVLAKWFLSPATEVGTAQARSLLGRYALVTTTLAHYEVGSALSRAWPEEPERVAKALTFLREHCGAPLELTADAAALTAEEERRRIPQAGMQQQQARQFGSGVSANSGYGDFWGWVNQWTLPFSPLMRQPA